MRGGNGRSGPGRSDKGAGYAFNRRGVQTEEPFLRLHGEQAVTRFRYVVVPPRATGTTWSNSNGPWSVPQYRQRPRSLRKTLSRSMGEMGLRPSISVAISQPFKAG